MRHDAAIFFFPLQNLGGNMKTLVVYYSNTGSNKYLADKIAHALEADIEAVKPRINFFPFLMLFSIINNGPGNKKLLHKIKEYDRIILCGPIWMGKLISPLHDFIKKYRGDIKRLYFVTCCGSSDAAKFDRFGHGLVFNKVKKILGDVCDFCEAFPIGLVVPEDKKKDDNAIMKTRLSDNNFTGEVQKRFENFIQRVRA
jgi:flavodoxin